MNNLHEIEPKLLKSERLVEYLLHEIRAGKFPDGSKLPAEKDLARLADVSVFTVRQSLKKLLDMKVIVKHQGKATEINASALGPVRRMKNFCWIGHDTLGAMNPVYFELYKKIMRYLLSCGSTLSLLPIQDEKDENYILNLIDSFDGVFMTGIFGSTLHKELFQKLQTLPYTLELDDILDSPTPNRIYTDNYAAGFMTGNFLANANRKSVVVCISAANMNYHAFSERTRGVIDALNQDGIRWLPLNCQEESKFDFASFTENMKDVLKEHPDIDTIWHPQDKMAIQIRKVFEKLTGKTDGTIRSCGIDGLPEVMAQEQYHASAAHSFDNLAKTAADTMLSFFSGSPLKAVICPIKPELIPWSAK